MKFIHDWRIKITLKHCLYCLADLQQAFFVNYLRKDYIKKQLYYQKKLNTQCKRFFKAAVKAKKRVRDDVKWLEIFYKISHLSEIIFSLNQLRLRVDDYTTFKICARELQQVEKFSVLLLTQLGKSLLKTPMFDFTDFEDSIHSFESIYNRTLQIVSVDPLVFMFFIQDLYSLQQEMQVLQQLILSDPVEGKENV